MKRLLWLLVSPLLLFSKVHYAKVEPLETITLKAAIAAQVTKANIEQEGKMVTGTIIQLDSKLDKIKLQSTKEALKLIERMITLNHQILKSLKDSLSKQKAYYNRILSINSASMTQKDNAFYAMSNAKTQYLSTKEKIDSLRKQQLDLKYEIAHLQDTISKKSIKVENKFLDKLLVGVGDFVNMGTPLAKIVDLSSAKLTLFLEAEELEGINEKTIYINNKATTYKITKIWKVTDEKFISSYRTEITIKPPKERFSKLLKVEFK